MARWWRHCWRTRRPPPSPRRRRLGRRRGTLPTPRRGWWPPCCPAASSPWPTRSVCAGRCCCCGGGCAASRPLALPPAAAAAAGSFALTALSRLWAGAGAQAGDQPLFASAAHLATVTLTPRRAVVDDLLLLAAAPLAGRLCALNAWDRHALHTHRLASGLKYRQLDVVQHVLGALDDAQQCERAGALLVATVDEACVAAAHMFFYYLFDVGVVVGARVGTGAWAIAWPLFPPPRRPLLSPACPPTRLPTCLLTRLPARFRSAKGADFATRLLKVALEFVSRRLQVSRRRIPPG